MLKFFFEFSFVVGFTRQSRVKQFFILFFVLVDAVLRKVEQKKAKHNLRVSCISSSPKRWLVCWQCFVVFFFCDMKNEFAIYSVSFYVLFIFLFGVFIDLCVDVAVDIYFVFSNRECGFRVEGETPTWRWRLQRA